MTEKTTHPFLEGIEYDDIDASRLLGKPKRSPPQAAIDAMDARRTPTKRERVIVKAHYDQVKKSR